MNTISIKKNEIVSVRIEDETLSERYIWNIKTVGFPWNRKSIEGFYDKKNHKFVTEDEILKEKAYKVYSLSKTVVVKSSVTIYDTNEMSVKKYFETKLERDCFLKTRFNSDDFIDIDLTN